ncbi:metallophosphoesterase [Haematomicrobium sanguinis]|uniref:metallophosphoesterase n=1 Tax=Haematomicrobium sanguinis TaxID=479106 RepID=UPI000478E01D
MSTSDFTATQRRGPRVLGALGVASLVPAAALAYAYGYERNAFQVREEQLSILPPGQKPLRILHLSDIHFVRGQKKKAAWLRSLADLQPDLVVNTGDNLSDTGAVPELLDALEPLMKFPGVFVPGSNDYYGPMLKNPLTYLVRNSNEGKKKKLPPNNPWPEMFNAFGRAGWIDLTNRNQSLAMDRLRLDFTGVDDPHLGRERYAGWPLGSSTSHEAPHLKIAVTHAPYQRVLDHFTAEGADLILAGHTHGGQVCIPGYGAITSNCDLPTWRASGLTEWELDGVQVPLNVSAGIGTSKYAPVRFACKPEAVLLTLT